MIRLIIKCLWCLGGCILLGIAVFGWITPVIGGTPFLFAALFCFSRGSKAIHDWLQNRQFVRDITAFFKTRSGSLEIKIKVIVLNTLGIPMAYVFSPEPYLAYIMSFVVLWCIGVTAFVATRPDAHEKPLCE